MLGTFGLAITQPSRLRSKVALIFSLVPALVNWTEFLCTHKILPLTHWHSPLLVQLPQFCHELQRLDVCHWVNWIESRYTSYSFRLRKKVLSPSPVFGWAFNHFRWLVGNVPCRKAAWEPVNGDCEYLSAWSASNALPKNQLFRKSEKIHINLLALYVRVMGTNSACGTYGMAIANLKVIKTILMTTQ